MNRERIDLAIATGRSWAERKADTLTPEVSPWDWPDVWQAEWDGRLPFRPGELGEEARRSLSATARHAASERWSELVIGGRSREDIDEEEHHLEVEAERLLQGIESDLPDGLHARREGERVLVEDDAGFERTVRSLDDAWFVVAEYEEHRSLRT